MVWYGMVWYRGLNGGTKEAICYLCTQPLKVSLQSSPIGPHSVITAIYTLYTTLVLYDYGIILLWYYFFNVLHIYCCTMQTLYISWDDM